MNAAWDDWKETRARLDEARNQSRRERIQGNIDSLKSRIERLEGVVEHKRDHLSDLFEKRDSARSEEFESVVEGWIQEEETAIEDIEEKLQKLQGWLEEAEENMGLRKSV